MTCLVTGNLTYIGWAKMEALGIKKLFTSPYFGGFGSDFCSGNLTDTWKDRAELVRIAAKKAGELSEGECAAAFWSIMVHNVGLGIGHAVNPLTPWQTGSRCTTNNVHVQAYRLAPSDT